MEDEFLKKNTKTLNKFDYNRNIENWDDFVLRKMREYHESKYRPDS